MSVSLGFLQFWRKATEFSEFFSWGLTPISTVDRAYVVEKIQAVQKLTTIIFITETIVPVSQARKLGELTVGETKLLYVARGEVRAGIDLAQLQSTDISINDEQLHIVLPPAQILDRKIDVEHSQVYDYDRGLFNLGPDVALDLQLAAQRQTLAQIQQAACQQGILEQAKSQARIALTELVGLASIKTIEIEFQPSTQDCASES